MKYLLTIILFITGCGSSNPQPIEPPMIPIPVPQVEQLYSYSVKVENETRSYNGLCIETDKLYCYPTTIANSEFVVSAVIDGDNVKIYHYVTRELVIEFHRLQISPYTLEVQKLGAVDIKDLNVEWFIKDFAGMILDEPVLSITFDNNILSGTDTAGCFYEGEATPLHNIYILDVTVSLCDDAGEYTGAIHTPQKQLRGLITNGEKAILIDFNTAL